MIKVVFPTPLWYPPIHEQYSPNPSVCVSTFRASTSDQPAWYVLPMFGPFPPNQLSAGCKGAKEHKIEFPEYKDLVTGDYCEMNSKISMFPFMTQSLKRQLDR